MVGLYAHCAFNLNPRAASIDTPLHALVDRPHIDHMHPDAVIGIAASADSRALTQQIYGDEIGWLPWIRPGFELALQLKQFADSHPHARGVVLEAHGLFTWGPTAKDCYDTTIEIINRAIRWLDAHGNRRGAFGPAKLAPLPRPRRLEIAAALMPRIRGLISADVRKVGHFDDCAAVLDFVNSQAFERLAALGTSCPDHFLRTKIRPLVLKFDPTHESEQQLIERLPAAVEAYRAQYAQYYERCKRAHSPNMRDPNAVVYLIPAVGMITFAADKATARIAAEFYINAINVMREPPRSRPIKRCPSRKLSTSSTGRSKKPSCGACRSLRPLPAGSRSSPGARAELGSRPPADCWMRAPVSWSPTSTVVRLMRPRRVYIHYGKDSSLGVWGDVTDERSMASLFAEASWSFGGVDICVSNAGIASAAAIEDTSLELWRRNMDILATGYFLVSRQCVKLLKAQGLGGSIVFIGSKNALAASPGAAAYCTAKASELHLARCLALECAPRGSASMLSIPMRYCAARASGRVNGPAARTRI